MDAKVSKPSQAKRKLGGLLMDTYLRRLRYEIVGKLVIKHGQTVSKMKHIKYYKYKIHHKCNSTFLGFCWAISLKQIFVD